MGISANIGFALNQSWRDLTASRAFNVTYTNTSPLPIMVNVNGTSGLNNVLYMTVGGVLVAFGSNYANGAWSGSVVIPSGKTYMLPTFGAISKWSELR